MELWAIEDKESKSSIKRMELNNKIIPKWIKEKKSIENASFY